jgi:predicted lipoprotein with Yx(FWY)xxD motif
MKLTRRFPASRIAVSVAGLAGFVALVPGSGAAQATTPGHKAFVVQVVNRSPIGNMLATTSGASLYIHKSGPCTGSCVKVWPRLLMPADTTKPKGAQCLSTVATAKGLQVTYRNQSLYTFVGDSGSNETGNGVDGFKAAKVSTSCP